MKFLDQAKIYVRSGNGGKGGDVIFTSVKELNTLIDFRYTQHFRAQSGDNGAGEMRFGKDGDDIIIRVPVGTEVLDEDQETVLIDFTEPGQTITFLKGGDGGFGNAHYKSSTNQAPRKKTPGWPGIERGIWLRLKLIADAGLVGMPNAGKSTFLASCTAAKPKIADYPFTTLHPNLGVVKAGDKEFVLADIPGLIEGASEGHGLGDRFLGHVERTAVLLHLVDITDDDPAKAYLTIRHELEAYGNGLAEKPEIVALNKADALGKELSEDVAKDFEEATGVKPILISGVSKEGVDKALFALNNVIQKARKEAEEQE